jgi:hypothetical protein
VGRVAQRLQFRVARLAHRGAGSSPALCASFWSESARRPGGEHSRIVAVSYEFETAKYSECSAMLRIGDRSTAL